MTTRRRLRLLLPLPVLAAAGLLGPLVREGDDPPPTPEEAAYRALPAAPPGARGPGGPALERSAVEHAAWLQAVPAVPAGDEPCAPEHLFVSWEAPPSSATHGNFVAPLGPAPTATTEAVNGIVQCRGSEDFAFMGFEARRVDGRWQVEAVPHLADHDQLEEVVEPEPEEPSAAPTPSPVPLPPPVPGGDTRFGAAIEGLAAYEPQRTCSATAKPGTLALRNLLLREHAGSRNLGIVRGCGIGGQSEHKEGRAFDWGLHASSARERAYAESFIERLLATDAHGNRHALARRMGVMYVIWDRRIWSSYRAGDGWRPYRGASAHTDHVHISLSWAGANARTSYWSGQVAEVLLASSPTGAGTSPALRTGTRVATKLASGAGEGRRRPPVATDATRSAEREARARRRVERVAEERARRDAWQEARERAAAERAAREQARRDAWQEARERAAAERAAREQARRERRRSRTTPTTITVTVEPSPTTTVATTTTTTTTTAPAAAPEPTTTTTIEAAAGG